MESAIARSFVLGTLLLSACVAQLGDPQDDEELDLATSGLRASRVTLDFHVFGYRCGSGTATCPRDRDQCICQTEYDHLNAVRVLASGQVVGHHIVTGSDSRRAEVEGQGNRLAVYINELNRDWEDGGVARADAMMAWARHQFSGDVPQWFFLNEISRGRWTRTDALGARYRQYVVDVVRRLARHHGRSVVVFSPFWRPGYDGSHHWPEMWRALAENAYIGIENYIPGSLIQRNGFSESYCRWRYQQSIDAYRRLGVPVSRQMLTEHFGSTALGATWGRDGVGIDAWIRAIRVRTRAARSLPFAGYVTYAWGANKTHRPSSERIRSIDAYLRVGARRLALPDHPSTDPVEGGDGGATEGAPEPVPPPPPPPPPPACERRSCGTAYMDYCGGGDDGCGGTLTCGDTCGDGLNCNHNGRCKKALGLPCAGPGQCASDLCHYTTRPGTAARCCHSIGGWCNSDLKCCFEAVCRSGRCVAP